MTPGEKLTQLRQRKGLTQPELCEAMNKRFPWLALNKNTYIKWELDVNEFSWEVGKAFALFYRITLDELIFPVRKLVGRKRKRRLYQTA